MYKPDPNEHVGPLAKDDSEAEYIAYWRAQQPTERAEELKRRRATIRKASDHRALVRALSWPARMSRINPDGSLTTIREWPVAGVSMD